MDDDARAARRRELANGIAARIREARGKLTQAALAERAGIAAPTISRYEAARVMPSAAALDAIGRALEIDPAWLLTGSGEGPAEAA